MTKVLIVDDEEVARLTLAEILRLEGYDITTVRNGEEAVEALHADIFDVMILDLKMAGMSGIDVLREVVDMLPGLSVIVLTAYGTIDTAIQAIRYRVHDYLLKPVAPEVVIESVEWAMARKSPPGRQVQEDRPDSGASRIENLPGGVVLTWDRRQITWETGSISLTPTEARLLRILFERKNEMVTHSELVYLIQGYRIGTEEAAKILRPVVSRLRQKLTAVPEWDDRIKNVRGAGYVLEFV